MRRCELGHKGMFAVTIGFFDTKDDSIKSQRVPLDARWGEAEDMIDLLATYQRQLESLGLEGLGLSPVRHQTGRRFAGSDACGDCHAYAYEVWEDSSHSYALTTLEDQEPRRDGDPECLSCHVVGWAPQRYEPFEGGFLSMQKTPHLAHNGCENCHGPARAHLKNNKIKPRHAAISLTKLCLLAKYTATLIINAQPISPKIPHH